MKDLESVNIGLVQMSCKQDVDKNILKAIDSIRIAAKKGAKIICLQELFSSIYFCYEENLNFFNLAVPIEGDLVNRFSALCKELDIVLVLSLFERRAVGVYHNTAVVIDADGRNLGIYRKSHIPDDPGFYEKFYFTPGDTGYKVFKTKYANIGVLICWDQWYPEAARITSMMGADILFYPTAIGWDMQESSQEVNKDQLAAWKTIQQGHAIANGVYVVAVNRVGIEHNTQFWGNSFISNPFGTIINQASQDNEEILVSNIQLSKNEDIRRVWPFYRDRRIDTYSPITERYIN